MVRETISAALAALVCGAALAAAPAAAQQAPVVVGGTPPMPGVTEDSLLWSMAEQRGTIDAYRSYLSTFPNGARAPEARAKLGQLLAGGALVNTGVPEQAQPAVPDVTAVTPLPETAPGVSPADAARAEVARALRAEATGQAGEAALGLSSDRRRAIQARLTAMGYDTNGVDGVFGSGSRRAIRAWQAAQGQAATGFLTAAQAAELGGNAAPTTGAVTGTPAQVETALDLSATDRRIIQARLTQLGHDTRGIDGKFGSGTRAAITAWQRDKGVAATGFLTRADADAILNAGTAPVVAPGSDPDSAARAELALNLTRDDRLAVQRALNNAGHDTRGIDGTFGSGTRRAIRAWQTGTGQTATGYLTAQQLGTLRDAAGAGTAVPGTGTPTGGASAADELRLNLSMVERTEVQSRLSALGYDPNGIDGKFGPGSRRAISQWQGDNGLAATGFLNADQLTRLRTQRRN